MTAQTLLHELEMKGLKVAAHGDKLLVAPRGALAPDLRVLLLQHKAEILALLQQSVGVPTPAARATGLERDVPHDHAAGRAASAPSSAPVPAPQTIPVRQGAKRLGAFTSCLWCGNGTWARYGGLPTCPACARSWPATRTPEKAKAHLWRLLDIWATMDEDAMSPSASSSEKVPVRTEANVKALNEDIMDIFAEHAEANAWFRAWRGLHLNARLS